MTDSASHLDVGQTARQTEALVLGRAPSGIWYRIALERSDEGPAVVLRMELTSGPIEDDSQEWDYGSVAFISGWISGTVAEGWLTAKEGDVPLSNGALPFEFRELPDAGHWDRLPSRSPRDEPWLTWPYRRIAFQSSQVPWPSARSRFLVAPNAPCFPSFDHAAYAFFHGRPFVDTRPPSADLVVVREQYEDVRIDRVTFSALLVEVTLSAPERPRAGDCRSVRVDFGPGPGSQSKLVYFGSRSQETVETFEVVDGVPDEWWVVVSEGNRWLDYRHLSRNGRWPPDAEHLHRGLDPTEEVRMLTQGGEGPAVEFKRELPSDRAGRRKLARTVAAFANGDGGTILFGVDDDSTIAGISESFREASDGLTRVVSDNLTTRPEVRLQRYDTEAGLVIGMVVEQGGTPPYGIDRSDPRYHVRRGATTVPALAEEVRSLARRGA